jgi:hypothetical protein
LTAGAVNSKEEKSFCFATQDSSPLNWILKRNRWLVKNSSLKRSEAEIDTTHGARIPITIPLFLHLSGKLAMCIRIL